LLLTSVFDIKNAKKITQTQGKLDKRKWLAVFLDKKLT